MTPLVKLCNPSGKNSQLLTLYPLFLSQISNECADSILETCQKLPHIVSLPHCVFVSMRSTPLKLNRHLAHGSFIYPRSKLHQPSPRSVPAPNQAARSDLHLPFTSAESHEDPGPSSTPLTGVLIYAGTSSSPAAL